MEVFAHFEKFDTVANYTTELTTSHLYFGYKSR